MNNIKLLTAVAVASAAAVFGVADDASAKTRAVCQTYATTGARVDEIRALEETGGQSNVVGMTLAEGERMFAQSFVSYGPDGAIKTRADVLKTYVDGKFQPWASSFEIKELEVKVYCDTATVVGLSEVRPKGAPPAAKAIRFRWLNVWAKPEGFWQIVASQFTPVK
jgi:hypothetical protein